MSIYTASLAAVVTTAEQDIFELTASASSRVKVRRAWVTQYSDAGDAQAEHLSILMLRGSTASGSGGSSVTPRNLEPWGIAADSAVEANNTVVASTASAQLLIADFFDIADGWYYNPPEDERIHLEASQRFAIRMSAPSSSITINAGLIFEEVGKLPS